MDKHRSGPEEGQDSAAQANPGAGPSTAEATAETLGSRLQRLLRERGWSIYRLHQESGLSQRHLGELVGDDVGKPRPGTLVRLADALGVPVVELDPTAPRGREFSVTVSSDDEAVLYAVSAKERRAIGGVVRLAILESVRRWREDPSVQTILGAMDRHEDE